MVISLERYYAAEDKSLEYVLEYYLTNKKTEEKNAEKMIKEINKYFIIDKKTKILEIGSAQGLLCIILQSLGYSCSGIEPYKPAIKVAKDLAKKLEVSIDIEEGFGEDIPKVDETCDFIFALSVMEHVKDVNKVFKEVIRVLKPYGSFYFFTASSLCPKQGEIRLFPFFPWYPNQLKKMIMQWATKNRPDLVGYTKNPAINWFTPWSARRLLKQAGFVEIYDRWDLRNENQYSHIKKTALKVIKSSSLTKLIADIFLPGCEYLAIKR